MSFRIFAAASGPFNLERNWTDEGDVYDLENYLNRVQAAGGGAVSFAQHMGTEAANQALPSAASTSAVDQATGAVGRLTAVHTLEGAFVLALGQAGGMEISLRTRAPSMLPGWPDSGAFVLRYYRPTRHSTVTFNNFLHDFTPALEAADLNRFMVLNAMAEVFSRWGGARTRNCAMLNLTITKT